MNMISKQDKNVEFHFLRKLSTPFNIIGVFNFKHPDGLLKRRFHNEFMY